MDPLQFEGGRGSALPSPVLPKKCCRSRDGSYAYVCSRGGSWVNTTLCRTHGLKSGACRRPETERQGLPMRPSHDSVRRSESSLHTVGPPVLLNSIIGTPGGRYMRLVTPLRAPFAAPIAPSHRGGLVQNPPPRQIDAENTTRDEEECQHKALCACTSRAAPAFFSDSALS